MSPSLHSYASYLVWKDLGGGFGWPLALPLGLYALQLPISWTVLMFFLEADNPGLVRHAELSSGCSAEAGEKGDRLADFSGFPWSPKDLACWIRVPQKGRGVDTHPHPCVQALVYLLLLYGLVVSMMPIWYPINKLAALLLLPYLAWLTVTGAITYHLWRDSLCPAYQPQPTEKDS